MADVQPLQGLRYSPEQFSDLSQIVTPPFDVISPEAQERYYQRNEHNIIRLERGKETGEDTSLNTVYTRAAVTFANWRLDGVFRQEESPRYYIYRQHFSHAGKSYTRTSLLARVRLEPWDARVILPHENTRKKDKEDRLQLLHACAANFSPLMCMYDDPEETLKQRIQAYTATEPETDIFDEDNERHQLYPITDEQQIHFIQEFFAQRQLYIADGHHRYTTALQYRDEVRQQRRSKDSLDGSNFVLMALIALEDPGMLVLPTHRILADLPAERLQYLTVQRLEEYFHVETIDAATSTEQEEQRLAFVGKDQPAFLLKRGAQTFLLTLNASGQQYMQRSGHTEAWNVLDVAVVQKILFELLLGITEEDLAAGRYVRYSHDTQLVREMIQDQHVQAVVLLNGIPFQQVRDVALADDRMPQKSTYLYPKLISGLVINPLW